MVHGDDRVVCERDGAWDISILWVLYVRVPSGYGVIGVGVVASFRPVVDGHLVVGVLFKDANRCVVDERLTRVRMDREDAVVGLVSGDADRLDLSVGLFMTRTGIAAWVGLERYLADSVAIFSIFGFGFLVSVWICGIVYVCTVTFFVGRAVALERVRGAGELACRLVGGFIVAAGGTYAVRAYRQRVFFDARELPVVDSVREGWFVPLP